MKILIIMFVYFSCIIDNIYSQEQNIISFNTQVHYKYQYCIDTLNLQNRHYRDMVLLINDSISLFTSENRLLKDSLSHVYHKSGGHNWARTATVMIDNGIIEHTNAHVFKYQNGIIRTIDAINGLTASTTLYEYEENIKDMLWEMCADTMEIEGYICQKAILKHGGRLWEAWFSTEFPYTDGPRTFCGLPGLIFLIYDTEGHFKFELLSITNKKREINLELFNGQSIEKIDKGLFFKERRNYQDNSFEIGVGLGLFPRDGNEIKQFAKKSALTNNNWIELYP